MKHIHFIGICGVAMSALAIAFKKANWQVTGSDAGFFPPISTHLKDAGVDFYPGWHVENMVAKGVPDMVVVGNVASSTNPEWEYVQSHHIQYKSYPEILAEYFIKKNSIVCAGTYGKTSSSVLLSFILSEADYDPSYMFGGLANLPSPSRGGLGRGDVVEKNDIQFPSAALSESAYSVVEGDEYKSARFDNRPKFAHYSPTHLLLTAIVWDHADVYPTEKSYFDAFATLIASVPTTGSIVVCIDNEKAKHMTDDCTATRITYGADGHADYQYANIEQTKNGLSFTVTNQKNTWQIESPMLGIYQVTNITGCMAMAATVGIAPEKSIQSIKKFTGMKRRLEKRFVGDITIFDDIAHSPAKAKSTLDTLRTLYSGKIICVFEPNTGNRQTAAIPGYDHAFDSAEEVIIPTLTKIKKDIHEKDEPIDSEQLAEIISRTHTNTTSIIDDKKLITHLKQSTHSGDVIVFLGSHGFRGMIDELIHRVSS